MFSSNIKIKLTPTSKVTKVWFHDEVFNLLYETKSIEEVTHKKIVHSLLPDHYQHFPYYVIRLSPYYNKNNENRQNTSDEKTLYKALILDSDRRIFTTIISLTDETKNQSQQITVKGFGKVNVTEISLKESEKPEPLPMFFDLSLEKNKNLKSIIDAEIKKLEAEKQKQIDDFWAGKSFKRLQVEQDPAEGPIHTKRECGLDKAVELFPSLKPISKVLDEIQEIETKYNTLLQKYLEYLSNSKNDEHLHQYILSKQKMFDDFSFLFYRNEINNLKSTQNRLNTDLCKIYVDYRNEQEKLNYIKRCLSWAIRYAQINYFNQIQKEFTNENRKEKIKSFNNHFLGFAQVHEDGTFSDSALIDEHLIAQSLADIGQTVNNLLGECNSTFLFSSDKQKNLVTGINEGAKIVKNAPQPPFKAWKKTFFAAAGFCWEEYVLDIESKLRQTADKVKTDVETKPEYVALAKFDLSNDRQYLSSLKNAFDNFELQVKNHCPLLALKASAADVRKQARALVQIENNNDGQLETWLKKKENELKAKYAEVENIVDDQAIFPFNNREIRFSKFPFAFSLKLLVDGINKAFDDIIRVEKSINTVTLNEKNADEHLNAIRSDLKFLKEKLKELNTKKNQLEALEQALLFVETEALRKRKELKAEESKCEEEQQPIITEDKSAETTAKPEVVFHPLSPEKVDEATQLPNKPAEIREETPLEVDSMPNTTANIPAPHQSLLNILTGVAIGFILSAWKLLKSIVSGIFGSCCSGPRASKEGSHGPTTTNSDEDINEPSSMTPDSSNPFNNTSMHGVLRPHKPANSTPIDTTETKEKKVVNFSSLESTSIATSPHALLPAQNNPPVTTAARVKPQTKPGIC